MAITSNCAEIIITNPQGSVSFNKLITTTELSPAKTIYSEDRVYLIQNSENEPQTFWWNLEKAIADGYASLEDLYDFFVTQLANQCGGGSGGGNIVKTITPADFSGSDYIDSDLIGKVPDTGFMLFADGGSGVLLHNGDGYTFDDTTGTITTDSGDYRLIIIT